MSTTVQEARTKAQSPIWQAAIVLEDGFNLNQLRDSGYYSITSPGAAPEVGDFYVQVTSGPVGGTAFAHQLLINVVTGAEWSRVYMRTSGWSSWVDRMVLNVGTDLSVGNKTSTTLDILSDTGNDATLPAVTDTEAGLMTAAMKTKLDGIEDSADVNVATDLAVANKTSTTFDITSSTGTDATLPAATGTDAGLMTAAMKTKLDGIAAGAEVNDTAAAILAKLVTVDGAGSGLDADLLDGQSSSYYQDAGNLNAGTLAAARMPALTGDVTTSAGAVATTIANDAVTNAKMANMATATIKGRTTAGTGDPEDLSASQARTVLGLATIATSASAADLSTGTLAAARMPALTGDVTTSAGAVATTIANSAVTNAKMANMVASTVKGRNTASTGAPEDVTMAQLGALLFAANMIRKRYTATTTIYVDPAGSNSGLGTVGSPYQTIQFAVSVAAYYIDLAFNSSYVTIQCAAGTYTEAVTLNTTTTNQIVIIGDETTPGNCIWDAAGGVNFTVSSFSKAQVRGFKLTNCSNALYAFNAGTIIYYNNQFDTATTAHMFAQGNQASILCFGSYEIIGGATYHHRAAQGGNISCASRTVTLTGTPAFSNTFASVESGSRMLLNGNTYSGAATGVRYNVILNSIIYVNGGGATYLPGNSAGTTATGGQYA